MRIFYNKETCSTQSCSSWLRALLFSGNERFGRARAIFVIAASLLFLASTLRVVRDTRTLFSQSVDTIIQELPVSARTKSNGAIAAGITLALNTVSPTGRRTTQSSTTNPTPSPTPSLSGAPSIGVPDDHDTESAIYDKLHSADTEMLGLTDWEQASLDGILNIPNITQKDAIDTCNPPNGVAKTCCLGTFSNGGNVNPNQRHECSTGFGQWEELKTAVKTFFQENPIPVEHGGREPVMKCDACQIVELARAHHLNITMLGDSMQSQVYEGLKCELSRRGYIVEESRKRYPQSDLYQEIASSVYLTIQSPMWVDAPSNATSSSKASSGSGSVTLSFYLLYLMPTAASNEKLVREMLSTSQVLVLGMGLHWKWYGGTTAMRKAAYAPAVTSFMDRAYHDPTSAVQLVVHRETSAQHFDSPGGDYTIWKGAWMSTKKKSRDICVKAIRGEASYWRERALRKATKAAGYQYIVAGPSMPAVRRDKRKKDMLVLPFYNLTEPLHTAHKDTIAGSHPDCTHYCSSPFLYMTLWRSLRLAMDRHYPVHKTSAKD